MNDNRNDFQFSLICPRLMVFHVQQLVLLLGLYITAGGFRLDIRPRSSIEV